MTSTQTNSSPQPNNIEHIEEKPKLDILQAELRQAYSDAGSFLDSQAANDNTRRCVWDGQSVDGRKWKRNIGKEPFPFEGASDARIFLADGIINEKVMLQRAAWNRSTLQPLAINSLKLGGAQKVGKLLNWLLQVHLKGEVDRELELLNQWKETHGMAVLAVFWNQETRVQWEEFRTEDLFAKAMGGMDQVDTMDGMDSMDGAAPDGPQQDPEQQAKLAEFVTGLMDPLQEDLYAAGIKQAHPMLSLKAARKVVKDLREVGFALIPKVEVLKSLPRWEAMRPFIDIFWPIGSRSLDRAPWQAIREWLTESQLRERITTHDWDEDFVNEAIKHKGQPGSENSNVAWRRGWTGNTGDTDGALSMSRASIGLGGTEDASKLIEIIHHYYKGIETKTGAPALYCTVYCPAVKDQWAKHGPHEYAHGEFPGIEFCREWIGTPTESRGVTELASSSQWEIKAQRDARTDVTSITTMPPMLVPMNKARTKLSMGPGTQHGERKPGEHRWMQPPSNDGRSVEIERATRADVMRYFGQHGDEVPAFISDLHAQDLTDKFLGRMVSVVKMTLQLCQQYLDEVKVDQVMGGMELPFQVSREEIQGQYDLILTFDARDLSLEYVTAKLKGFTELVLAADTEGIIDRAAFVTIAAGWLDPNLASRITRDPQAAAAGEVADEKQNFISIMAGVEPEMKDGGQNFGLRLQTLMEMPEKNPALATRLQAQPDSIAIYQNRIKHFQFMLQQQDNAQTGRVGAEPALPQ